MSMENVFVLSLSSFFVFVFHCRISTKDHMKLYQHSVRCPVAMQIFLDANPQYWRFIPMTLQESQRPEQQSIQGGPVFSEELDWNLRLKEDYKLYVEAIPKPPNGFTFSNRQILFQLHYFHKKRDQTLPNQDIDLYNATIVAVRKFEQNRLEKKRHMSTFY